MPHIASHRWSHPACRAPRVLHHWLVNPGSLTKRLKARFPHFHVRLLSQRYGQPCRDELKALALPRRSLAVVREVVLMSGEVPLVFGHSVMPRQALMKGFRGLRRQGTTPLGATLFANPKVKRSRLAFRGVDKRHTLHARAEKAVGKLPKRLWARRSRFELGTSRILVTEVFLPAVTEYRP